MKIEICTYGKKLCFMVPMPRTFGEALNAIDYVVNDKVYGVMNEFGIIRDWAEFIYLYRLSVDWDRNLENVYVDMARCNRPIPE